MRVALLADLAAAPARRLLLAEAALLLREWGEEAEVLLVGPEPPAHRDRDLYLLAGEGPHALAHARALDEAGATLLDSYRSVRATCDRAGTLGRLAAAGLPVARGPAARRRPTHRLDGLGGQVFGVARGARPGASAPAPISLGSGLRELGLRAGRALGLELFALDLRVTADGAAVSAVRPFPSLQGVPDAALRLADFVYAAGQRLAAGDPPRRPGRDVTFGR